MSVITLDHVTLSVGGRAVLREVSCAIAQGEFIGVLGPNGAGKTTLFRAILGLLRPDAGRIAVFGRTPQRGDAAIGYLPQVRTLLPDLRVRGLDFISSSLDGERWGLPLYSARARKAVEETLAAIGARELAKRPLA
jgi:zinc/manganese transport system ATP-binding protein